MRDGRWANYTKIKMRFLAVGILSALSLLAQPKAWDLAFNHFYNLEYDAAIAELQKQVAADPGSPDLHNHIAQCIEFREMFQVGALESELVSGNNSFLRRPKIDTTPMIGREIGSTIRHKTASRDAPSICAASM